MQEFINSRIGKQLYPADNSYSKCLTDSSITNPHLAGTCFRIPKLVTIISEPYPLTYESFGKICTKEFVTVLYEGEVYIVLNHFRGYYLDSDHDGSGFYELW